jgi:hypothetical protein
MEVRFHPQARRELKALGQREQEAVERTVEKLRVAGFGLGFPHVSRVRSSDRIWELRPNAGRCRVRPLFRVVGGSAMIAAIGPEAHVDRRGFARAIASAERRLAEEET